MGPTTSTSAAIAIVSIILDLGHGWEGRSPQPPGPEVRRTIHPFSTRRNPDRQAGPGPGRSGLHLGGAGSVVPSPFGPTPRRPHTLSVEPTCRRVAAMTTEPARVPVRTILATIGLILATVVAVLFVIGRSSRCWSGWSSLPSSPWRSTRWSTGVQPARDPGPTVAGNAGRCSSSGLRPLAACSPSFAVPLATGGHPARRAAADHRRRRPRRPRPGRVNCSPAPTPCSWCRTTRTASARSPPASVRPALSVAARSRHRRRRHRHRSSCWPTWRVLEGPKVVDSTLALLAAHAPSASAGSAATAR